MCYRDWYNDDAQTPVYTRDKNIRTPKDTLELLLNFEDQSKICSAQPLRVQHSSTFIVDVTKLKDPKDIKCDDLGAWKNNSRKSFSFFIDEKLGYILAISTKDGESRQSEGLDILYVLRQEYYQLHSSPDFHKITYTIISKYKTWLLTNCHALISIYIIKQFCTHFPKAHKYFKLKSNKLLNHGVSLYNSA